MEDTAATMAMGRTRAAHLPKNVRKTQRQAIGISGQGRYRNWVESSAEISWARGLQMRVAGKRSLKTKPDQRKIFPLISVDWRL